MTEMQWPYKKFNNINVMEPPNPEGHFGLSSNNLATPTFWYIPVEDAPQMALAILKSGGFEGTTTYRDLERDVFQYRRKTKEEREEKLRKQELDSKIRQRRDEIIKDVMGLNYGYADYTSASPVIKAVDRIIALEFPDERNNV